MQFCFYLFSFQVMRWLDDVGLPQHKEMFLTARVDGRMLHRLTMDDLATMHITSALHVASLKKGIKVGGEDSAGVDVKPKKNYSSRDDLLFRY